MDAPVVSVVLAYYNPGVHLRAAVESVLAQTFGDFEFILIDDGSTDGSRGTLDDIDDKRIRHVDNGGNLGLIASLNRGLSLARGRYTARMDGDDLCLPERFRRQVDYLEAHPEVDMVATRVELIDERDHSLGTWDEDARHVSPEAIRRFLPRNNSIAHPTIMARTEVIRSFGYRREQKGTEDYDLWLRWAAAGRRIHKLDEALLRHRIVSSGVTRNRQRNVFRFLALAKWRFLAYRVRTAAPGGFELRTFLWMVSDVAMAVAKECKRMIGRA